jgi:hypothetical protein
MPIDRGREVRQELFLEKSTACAFFMCCGGYYPHATTHRVPLRFKNPAKLPQVVLPPQHITILEMMKRKKIDYSSELSVPASIFNNFTFATENFDVLGSLVKDERKEHLIDETCRMGRLDE